MSKKITLFIKILTCILLLVTTCCAPTEAEKVIVTAEVEGPGVVEKENLAVTALAAPAEEALSNEIRSLRVGCNPLKSLSRNFNPFTNALWPTTNGIHEPLMLFNVVTGEMLPWLATKYEWKDDPTRLVLTLRQSINWSDGLPFTSKDVAFTFNLILSDLSLSAPDGFRETIKDIRIIDDFTVEFLFNEQNYPLLYNILAQNIVPEHIWSMLTYPISFSNGTPVGTGPFTEIVEFTQERLILERNPFYWQKDKPFVNMISCEMLNNNDQITALLEHRLDWVSIPLINDLKKYINADIANHKFWYSTYGPTWLVLMNFTRSPFNDIRVRHALSQSIDRDALIYNLLSSTTHKADATGLSDGYPSWKNPEAIITGETWLGYDLTSANQLLDEAGLIFNAKGWRTFNGNEIAWQIVVLDQSGEMLDVAEAIAQNLTSVGLKTQVLVADEEFWRVKVSRGDFDLALSSSVVGPTPLEFYRDQMSSLKYQPIGKEAAENWSRFVYPEVDELINQFIKEEDTLNQKSIMDRLQLLYAENLPSLPLFPAPSWYEYDTQYFNNFPTPQNPYAIGDINNPTRILILLNRKEK